jgi:hypothetical protein
METDQLPTPNSQLPTYRIQLSAVVIAGLLGLAWGAPIVGKLVADVDFPFHIATAEAFAATGRITMPHFLLQVLLGSVLATGVAPAEQAALVFFSALYAVAAGLICWYVARGSRGMGGWLAAALLAAAVLMSAPLVPRHEVDVFLIGYFPPNAYHNPTMVVAKPLLVLALMAAVAAVTRTGPVAGRELILLTLPIVLLGIAKPNYLGCLVPVLAVTGIWKYLRMRGGSRPADPPWMPLARISMVCGAAVLTLAGTWVLYRSLELGAGAGVTFAPLVVIGNYAAVDAAAIARSLLASLAFPLAVAALWPRAAWRDPALRLAWGGTLVGLFISYFIAEAGDRLYDGNFLWTGQMAVFVLFVAAAAFVRGNLAGRNGLLYVRAAAVAIVLLLHVQAGIRHALVKLEPSAWLTFWT